MLFNSYYDLGKFKERYCEHCVRHVNYSDTRDRMFSQCPIEEILDDYVDVEVASEETRIAEFIRKIYDSEGLHTDCSSFIKGKHPLAMENEKISDFWKFKERE